MSEIEFLNMIQGNQAIIHKICRIYRDTHEDREDWSAFLIICFTGLDAVQKPILANAVLIISVTLPIILNIYGYQLSKHLIAGKDICSSMQKRIDLLKRFAVASFVLRVILIAGVGYFFISSISIDNRKGILIGAAIIFLMITLYMLICVWTRRIGKLSSTLRLLKERT